MRIAVGGIRHETNTFSTLRTQLNDFQVLKGDEILQSPFWEAVRRPDVDFLPTLDASARPHGLVTRECYVRLRDGLLERLAHALPIDGVYLDLHGAMEVEAVGDGETDLLTAIRRLVGPDVLISTSLDLHANVSPSVVASANILTAMRTAPHRDRDETRQRAISHLVRCLQQNVRPAAVLIKPPLLLPGEFAVTEVEPARSLYRRLEEIEHVPGILDASLLIGCAWTDSPYTSTSVVVVSERDRERAHREATQLALQVWNQREAFRPDAETARIDEAIGRALSAEEPTVFISDSGDNVTAGGAGDIPLFVERMIAAGAPDAVIAGIADAEAVARCADVGKGAQVALRIGGTLDPINGSPFGVTGTVVHLHPEERPTLAVLRSGGVDIILTADRRAFTSLASFQQAGIDPFQRKIVVVKLGYLYPELRDRAPRAILALSPGFTDLRVDALPYQRLRRPIYPLDPVVEWRPSAE